MSRGWFLGIGVLFLVVGAGSLRTTGWVEAAWCFAVGSGNLYIAAAQKRPELLRGAIGSRLVVLWVLIVGILTMLRLNGA